MRHKKIKRTAKREPPSHLDAQKQLNAAYYNLDEARTCFDNVNKIGTVPPDWHARITEIVELIDYLKRRTFSFMEELKE